MGLIKKSVSDIERKAKYARYVMRVLKECNMVSDFIEYTRTDNYKYFRNKYMKRHGTTDVWYDCRTCGEILGTCNFSFYFYSVKKKDEKYNTYALVIAYLALFDKEEYYRYYSVLGRDTDSASSFITRFLDYSVMKTHTADIDMVKKWIKEKKILYGSKN
jgi:hypothetical protein